jgi:hypothetical protein
MWHPLSFSTPLRELRHVSLGAYHNWKLALALAELAGHEIWPDAQPLTGLPRVALFQRQVGHLVRKKRELEELGWTVACIVSVDPDAVARHGYTPNEVDIATRDCLLAGQPVPAHVNALLFNSTIERGISVLGEEWRVVLSHDADEVARIQSLGRFRRDDVVVPCKGENAGETERERKWIARRKPGSWEDWRRLAKEKKKEKGAWAAEGEMERRRNGERELRGGDRSAGEMIEEYNALRNKPLISPCLPGAAPEFIPIVETVRPLVVAVEPPSRTWQPEIWTGTWTKAELVLKIRKQGLRNARREPMSLDGLINQMRTDGIVVETIPGTKKTPATWKITLD